MILRRFIKHVRNQEWTAVFLDFIIVVMGIFVGLQVTNWSASRADRALEHEYLERLLTDVQLSIDRTSSTRGFMVDHRKKAKLILDSLLVCELAPENRDDFALGLSRLGRLVPSAYILGTLDEMQSSGKFTILRNTELKDSLNALRASAQNEQSLILSIAARVGPSMAHMDYWVVVTSDVELRAVTKIGWDDIDLDFEALCADTKFRGALTMTRSITQVYIDWNETALEKLTQTKALLQKELGIEPEPIETMGGTP